MMAAQNRAWNSTDNRGGHIYNCYDYRNVPGNSGQNHGTGEHLLMGFDLKHQGHYTNGGYPETPSGLSGGRVRVGSILDESSTNCLNLSYASAGSAYGVGCHGGNVADYGSAGYKTWGTSFASHLPAYVWVRESSISITSNISAGTPSATEEKSPGPVAYWKFDEGYGTTTRDRTTNNNDGTITGATWQTEDMCISGKCLYFDGSVGKYVNAGTGSSLGITDKITISAWIRPTSNIDSADRIYTGNNGGFGTDGIVKAWFHVDGTWRYSPTVTSYVNLNQWNLWTATYDIDTKQIKIYINGILRGTTTLSGLTTYAITKSSNQLYIGTASPTSDRVFKGFIDEVKIYPYARTAAQIKADYASRGATKGSAATLSSSKGQGDYLSSGLIAYWKMDEASGNAADSSGNVNTGTWYGTGSHYPAGKFSNGGGFNGTDDYVDCGVDSSLDIDDEITVTAWIRASTFAFSSGNGGYIVARNYHYPFAMRLTKDTGYLSWVYHLTDSSYEYHNSNLQLQTNIWYHVAVSHKYSTGEITYYLNGIKEVDTAQYTGSPTQSSSYHIEIGGRGSNERNFPGLIDEVRIYNRALSPLEVRHLYEYAPGPVLHYKFDENTGTTLVNDSSGNGFTGTMYGSMTESDWVPGKYGSALEFDGAGDSVDATLTGVKFDDYTVEFWANESQLNSEQEILVLMLAGTSFYAEYGNAYRVVDNVLSITTPASGVVGSSSHSDFSNNWVHLAFTRDSSDTVRIYKNGVFQVSAPGSASTVTSPGLEIGGVYTNRDMIGKVDDVRIYNYARTQKQILEDMSARGGSALGGNAPVGYWKFDEGYGTSAKDSSIYGNNGTITGATWTNAGKFNKALSFDGTGDYVNVGNVASLNFERTSALSIDFWVKAPVTLNKYFIPINKLSWVVGNKGWRILSQYNGAGLTFLLADNHTVTDINITVNNVLDNTWHHVVFTYNGNGVSGGMNGYLDGVLQTSGGGGNLTSSILNSVAVTIGGTSTYSGTGLIDEVKIYNYALTEDEIKAEYNQSKVAVMGTTKNTSSTWDDGGFGGNPPVAEWKFEEHSGTYAYDTSGNGNTGTITGSTWSTGKVGSALNFNGTNDKAQTSSSILTGTGDFTIEGWINRSVNGTTDYIAGNYGTGTCLDGVEFYTTTTNVLRVHIGGGVSSIGTLNAGNWDYVTVTRSSGAIKLYINGKQDGTGTLSSSIGGNCNWAIGNGPNYTSERFNGKIDQVRIYDYARTPAQVAWDYNKGKPIAHYKMDKGEGTTIYDSSGNGNNGTLTLGSLGQTSAGSVKINANTAWYNGRNGKQNYSLNFDGSDDKVSIPNISIPNDFSISFWAIADSYPKAWNGVISNDYSPYQLTMEWNSNGYIILYTSSNGTSWTHTAQSASNLNTGTWYHIVGVKEGSTTKLYVDGKQSGNTGTGTNIYNSIFQDGFIGYYGTGANCFNGQIDDVQIYNYALTPAQIKTVYNLGAARLGTGD